MTDDKDEPRQLSRQEITWELKEKQIKENHQQHIKRLKNYRRVLIETAEYIRAELPNTDTLIRLLEQLQKEELSSSSFNKFCKKNFGFDEARLWRLLKKETRLREEETESIIIFLNKER